MKTLSELVKLTNHIKETFDLEYLNLEFTDKALEISFSSQSADSLCEGVFNKLSGATNIHLHDFSEGFSSDFSDEDEFISEEEYMERYASELDGQALMEELRANFEAALQGGVPQEELPEVKFRETSKEPIPDYGRVSVDQVKSAFYNRESLAITGFDWRDVFEKYLAEADALDEEEEGVFSGEESNKAFNRLLASMPQKDAELLLLTLRDTFVKEMAAQGIDGSQMFKNLDGLGKKEEKGFFGSEEQAFLDCMAENAVNIATVAIPYELIDKIDCATLYTMIESELAYVEFGREGEWGGDGDFDEDAFNSELVKTYSKVQVH